jgi:hypothetical protein
MRGSTDVARIVMQDGRGKTGLICPGFQFIRTAARSIAAGMRSIAVDRGFAASLEVIDNGPYVKRAPGECPPWLMGSVWKAPLPAPRSMAVIVALII